MRPAFSWVERIIHTIHCWKITEINSVVLTPKIDRKAMKVISSLVFRSIPQSFRIAMNLNRVKKQIV